MSGKPDLFLCYNRQTRLKITDTETMIDKVQDV